MAQKKSAAKLRDSIKDTVENAKDSISEAGHRTAAKGEKAKREIAGDELTIGEKVGSFVKEKKNQTQAELDANKRKLRNHR